MSDSTPMPSALHSAARSRRPKLHRIYFALAAFDVLTVVFSLYLINRITGMHAESVEVNRDWANELRELGELRGLAIAVNTPGNDAFRDLKPDFSKVEEAWRAFDAKRDAVRRSLTARVDQEMSGVIERALDRIGGTMETLTDHSRDVHEAIARRDLEVAGASMALMDADFNEVTRGIARLEELVRGMQSDDLTRQASAASSLRGFEVLIGGLVTVMVLAVTVYGHKLAVQMRQSADELHKYREHLETLVEARTRELDESHRRLRISERLASIGTLAAGLGHDMNNVLFPARCRLETLAAAPNDEEADQELEALLDAVDYLQKLSEGLRLLSLDPLELDARAPRRTSPAAWWAETGRLFHAAVPRHCTFETEIPADLPDLAIAPHQLTQIVFNLVVNAGDAIETRGHIRLDARALDDGAHVRLSVTDDGCGMTEDVRQHALDPFFTTKTRTFSTGLGLALVHGIARAAGGTLSIDSQPGQGACISVELPVAEDEAAAGAAQSGRTDTAAPIVRVSLADRRLGTMISSLLRQSGLSVSVGDAPNGASVWVMEHTDRAEGEVGAYLGDESNRRVVMFVDEPLAWASEAVTQIRRTAGMHDIQIAVGEAVAQVRNGPA